MEYQRTIKKEISFSGVGLHTGKKAHILFKPAEPNTGILFRRIDLASQPLIKADILHLLSEEKRPRRTSIAENGVEIHTIEHILSAILGLGIDNLVIEIDNNEFPGGDGSSTPFTTLFNQAGYITSSVPKNCFHVREPFFICEDEVSLIALPAAEFKVSYTLDYKRSFLPPQYASFSITKEVFEKEIALARTFCLEEEVEKLQQMGLGKGSNYENTVVIGENGIIDNRLRIEDEPVRHKILDLIGDLALLGLSIKGHIIAIKSGHSINVKLVKRMKEQVERGKSSGVGSPAWVEIKKSRLEKKEILSILPHRPPFLFVDKIIELEEDKRAVGIKEINPDEFYFKGHFPEHPVMPGVLIIEAMAQVAGVLMLKKTENRGKLAYFMAINNVKFRKAVMPGDTLRMEVEVIKLKKRVGQVHTKALVDNKIAAEADLMFALVNP
ncbi:MAG: bifunctional UDP-3-O-[3-hydroxymyristoyl] N-acetylglucosamine deacetylase/3-hydroxyacyl-ACP dehydratase [Candidatus Omnitrophica bacterium]|nr:bifunctional UDP-3-O-[3-hydroxymyristoyl] N-acetylglucosamine deacetylase/3-hydroxyacyl-ACP dehydratase [Candidatus Omnitrophota bacterium]